MSDYKEYETKQFKVIMPGTLNDHDTLFGGTAMQWMDEVGYITAIRYARHNMITVSVDKVRFLRPVESGNMAEIIGNVEQVGNAIIRIRVEVFIEKMCTAERHKAVEAIYSYAAVNGKQKPVRIRSNATSC